MSTASCPHTLLEDSGSAAFLATALLSRLGHAEDAAGAVVAVLPLGPFPAALLDKINAGLKAELGCKVVAHPTEALPPTAFYRPRKRYRAEKLLKFLRARRVEPATKILGVTTVDISTTAHGVYDWGILGLGQIGGRLRHVHLPLQTQGEGRAASPLQDGDDQHP